MDFCANIFNPQVGIENIIAVRKRYEPSYSDLYGPILHHETIEELTTGDDEGARVMMKMNAFKVLREEKDFEVLETQGINGLVAHTKRGQLGIRRKAGVSE